MGTANTSNGSGKSLPPTLSQLKPGSIVRGVQQGQHAGQQASEKIMGKSFGTGVIADARRNQQQQYMQKQQQLAQAQKHKQQDARQHHSDIHLAKRQVFVPNTEEARAQENQSKNLTHEEEWREIGEERIWGGANAKATIFPADMDGDGEDDRLNAFQSVEKVTQQTAGTRSARGLPNAYASKSKMYSSPQNKEGGYAMDRARSFSNQNEVRKYDVPARDLLGDRSDFDSQRMTHAAGQA